VIDQIQFPPAPRRAGWVRENLRLFSPGQVGWSRLRAYLAPQLRSLDGLRILHVSDLHLGQFWFTAYDQLLQETASKRFDVIAITGDLIDKRWNPNARVLRHLAKFLDALTAPLGVYVILGNHDGDLLAPYVTGSKATLLHPGIAQIPLQGATMEIVGLPCVHRTDLKPRLLGKIGAKAADTLRILLSHYPDHVLRTSALQPDLVLAGHTHGGQVCMPSGRPIITHDRLPKKMACGVHRIENGWLVVSRGVGFATYPIRLFAPPEVSEIQFVCGTARAGANQSTTKDDDVNQDHNRIERGHNRDFAE